MQELKNFICILMLGDLRFIKKTTVCGHDFVFHFFSHSVGRTAATGLGEYQEIQRRRSTFRDAQLLDTFMARNAFSFVTRRMVPLLSGVGQSVAGL